MANPAKIAQDILDTLGDAAVCLVDANGDGKFDWDKDGWKLLQDLGVRIVTDIATGTFPDALLSWVGERLKKCGKEHLLPAVAGALGVKVDVGPAPAKGLKPGPRKQLVKGYSMVNAPSAPYRELVERYRNSNRPFWGRGDGYKAAITLAASEGSASSHALFSGHGWLFWTYEAIGNDGGRVYGVQFGGPILAGIKPSAHLFGGDGFASSDLVDFEAKVKSALQAHPEAEYIRQNPAAYALNPANPPPAKKQPLGDELDGGPKSTSKGSGQRIDATTVVLAAMALATVASS